MAGDRELVSLGPWPFGLDNQSVEGATDRRALRTALNVDITKEGRARRRRGRQLAFALPGAHSIYGENGPLCLVASGTKLYRIDESLTPTEIYDDLRADAPLAYTMIEPYVRVSDGVRALRVSSSGVVTTWAVESPTWAAALESANGAFTAGRYGVAVSFVSPEGEESALAHVETYADVSDGRGLVVSWSPPAAGIRARVYITKPNGTELLQALTAPAGAASVSISNARLGAACATLDLDTMPAGEYEAYFNGRLYAMTGDLLSWSEPNHYTLWNPELNFMPFSEPGTMLAASPEGGSGVYVGLGSRTYYLRGDDPSTASLVEAYPAGVIAGSLAYVPGEKLPMDGPPAARVPMWLASNGVFCAGLGDGTVLPVTEARFATKLSTRAAAMYRHQNGLSQYVATLVNATDNPAAVGASVSATIVRNGVEIE